MNSGDDGEKRLTWWRLPWSFPGVSVEWRAARSRAGIRGRFARAESYLPVEQTCADRLRGRDLTRRIESMKPGLPDRRAMWDNACWNEGAWRSCPSLVIGARGGSAAGDPPVETASVIRVSGGWSARASASWASSEATAGRMSAGCKLACVSGAGEAATA